MARSFGEDAAPPGKTASALRSKYDRLEANARRERLGAWGEGAATPTMELSDGAGEPKPDVSTNKVDPDTGMPDVTDLMPSISDVLGSPIE
jgi:hypothetical protein